MTKLEPLAGFVVADDPIKAAFRTADLAIKGKSAEVQSHVEKDSRRAREAAHQMSTDIPLTSSEE